MERAVEDGLHPMPDHNPYTDLPQAYQPEKNPEWAPEVANRDSEKHAPVEPVDFDDVSVCGRNDGEKIQPTNEKRILGMKRKTAIVSGVVILVAIIAIAIGVGVGVGVSGSDANGRAQSITSSNSTSSSAISSSSSPGTQYISNNSILSTSTMSQVASATSSRVVQTSGFSGMAEVLCPAINNTDVTIGNSKFEIRCGVHWPNNSPAENNNGTVQPVGSNGLAAYTLNECLQMCIDYNTNQTNPNPNQNGSGCLAVTFNANLTDSFSKYSQNCFLKDRPGIYDEAMYSTESAVLINT